MFTSIVISIFTFLSLVNLIENTWSIFVSTIVFIVFFKIFSDHDHLNLLDVDILAGRSSLRNVNPIFKLGFTFVVILTCITSSHIGVCIFVVVTVSIMTIIFGKLKIKYYMGILKLPLLFISLSSIAIMINVGDVNSGYFDFGIFNKIFSVTYNSQRTSMELFFKAYAGLCTIYFFGITTPVGDIISAFRKLHMPEVFIELMYLVYRYIHIVDKTFSNLNISAGLRFGYGDFSKGFSTSKSIAVRLLNNSFAEAIKNYDAMESRLYEGKIKFVEEKKVIGIRDKVFFITYITFMFLILYRSKG